MFVLLTTHHESDDNEVESVLPPNSLNFLSPLIRKPRNRGMVVSSTVEQVKTGFAIGA